MGTQKQVSAPRAENSTSLAVETDFSDGLIAFCRTFRAQTLATETVRRSTDAITDTLAC
ncbi:MAG: hypothetical protein RLZZ481_1912, partial [Pseudomonadota bacterium]